MAYTDDLAIVVRGRVRTQIEARAQNCLDAMNGWCERHKLEISNEKTHIMVVKGKFKGGDPVLRNNHNESVREVGTAEYLGVHLDSGLKLSTHYDTTSREAGTVFQKLRRVARANWGMWHGGLLKVYQAVFVPKMIYVAGAWGDRVTKANIKRLEKGQRAALITVTRAYRTMSDPTLVVISGSRPIVQKIEKERLRHGIRKRRTVRIEGSLYDPERFDRAELLATLEERQEEVWQSKWEGETRERHTFEFFPSIRARAETSWIEPTYYLTQYLCGHDKFRSKLLMTELLSFISRLYFDSLPQAC